MDRKKKLPVGVDDFSELRTENNYYLDKTDFIRELVNSQGKVNLFTRPRRFGKTLIMSMLKSFFEIGGDPGLFEGLAIAQEKEICEEYQGKFPVFFLSLKGVEAASYEEALNLFSKMIAVSCQKMDFLLASEKVYRQDKQRLKKLINEEADESALKLSLVTIIRMLHAHYGKKVILLIDEYDVPLDKSSRRGYYDEMLQFFRTFFGEAFKTNPDLYFAVLTGCLRVSKESIFTGVNNMKTDSISGQRFDEYFGFTDKDVRKILSDYHLENAYQKMKEWYDGYRFGSREVYCPWDVICYCDDLTDNEEALPQVYWNNTSSNEIVRLFIDKADATTRNQIERLIAGESIEIHLTEILTYGELEDSIENLWSVLYLTGYLTLDRNKKSFDPDRACLVIPNLEVRKIFIEKIRNWFSEIKRPQNQKNLYMDLWSGDEEAVQDRLNWILMDTISYHDYHENYYHGLLAGMLLGGEYTVLSNREMGMGRSDIFVEDGRNRRVLIIEVKRSESYEGLEVDSQKAVDQILDNRYAAPYLQRKFQVSGYGISFFRKDCCVKKLPIDE